jgi:hypothetical protein
LNDLRSWSLKVFELIGRNVIASETPQCCCLEADLVLKRAGMMFKAVQILYTWVVADIGREMRDLLHIYRRSLLPEKLRHML